MTQANLQQPSPFLPPPGGDTVISLNGDWRFARVRAGDAPPADAEWETRTVPGDASTQAAQGAYDWEKKNAAGLSQGLACFWRRGFLVPEDIQDKQLCLRFEGAAYQAEVSVNGQPAGTHKGAFTAWELDITSLVTPGAEARLQVITSDDTRLNIENTGGLIRGVSLVIRGQAHINRLHALGQADGALEVLFQASAGGRVSFSLAGPEGQETNLGAGEVRENTDHRFLFHCTGIQTWDAEHPRLYTLQAAFQPRIGPIRVSSRRFGFRTVEREGARVLVNGQPIKLRGICRTDSDPQTGKALSRERLEQELRLYRDANINFVRTIGHPPQEALLDLCDELGFYVQADIALGGVDQPPQPPTQNDPRFLDEYLGALREAVERDLSHPALIIWSLGSQSCWGANFSQCFDTLKALDTTRLTSFSYPMTTQGEARQTDLWPVQYAAWNLDLGKKYDHMLIGHTYGIFGPPGYALGCAEGFERPVLHEQIAPAPLVNREEQLRDPGVRDFWGQTINRLWPRLLDTPGALGCAVESGVDRVTVFAGGDKKEEGGILDCWLRPKPEYFHLKTAYCPVRLEGWAGRTLTLRNGFCHTNLRDTQIQWRDGRQTGSLRPGDIGPGDTGQVELPADAIEITLTDHQGRALGVYAAPEKPKPEAAPAFTATRKAPALSRTAGETVVHGEGFEARFSEESGLISLLTLGGKPLLRGGPFLNAPGLRLPDWQLLDFAATEREDRVVVTIKGSHGQALGLTFTLAFDAQGGLDARYHIDVFKAYSPREVKIRIGLDPGGLDELGIAFLADGALDTFQWDSAPDPLLRGAVFPAEHIGRPGGLARRFAEIPAGFGQAPLGPWGGDDRHYALFGPYALSGKGTNDFRSTKARVRTASLLGQGGAGLRLQPLGEAAVRLAARPLTLPPRAVGITYQGDWWERADKSGASHGYEMLSQQAGSRATVAFTGSGIAWYGPLDMIGGLTRVYLDGNFVAEVSQAYEPLEQAGFSRGHEKRYGRLLYAAQGLVSGPHTLALEVTGRREERSDYAYCVIDSFEVISAQPSPVLVMVNQRRNYTRLAWGNYMEPPIHPSAGDTGGVALRFFMAQKEAT